MTTLTAPAQTKARVILRPPQAVEGSCFSPVSVPTLNKWVSLLAAVAVHAAILFISGAAFYRPAQFGVESGIASLPSIAVDLVEAAEEEVEAPPAPVKPEFSDVAPAVPKPQEKKALKPQARSIAGAGSDGALWSEPKYLANRPPRYPARALANKIEGTAVLLAEVDEKGRPTSVRLEKTSGDTSLDEAALQAVRKWSFNPARVGNLTVPSRSRIPITFRIESAVR